MFSIFTKSTVLQACFPSLLVSLFSSKNQTKAYIQLQTFIWPTYNILVLLVIFIVYCIYPYVCTVYAHRTIQNRLTSYYY